MKKLNKKQIDKIYWIARWISIALVMYSSLGAKSTIGTVITVPIYGIICYFEGERDGYLKCVEDAKKKLRM